MKGGVSVESTMGFTALDGLPMGTRPGQLDPGVVLHLIEEENGTLPERAAAVTRLLYSEAGLKGLSGIEGGGGGVPTDEERMIARHTFALTSGTT